MSRNRLYLGGVSHLNPLGRTYLLAWLEELRSREPTPPAFVAIEWGEALYRQSLPQRDVLRSLARDRWPDLPESSLNHIRSSIGYEADTHKDIFPEAKVVWLDDERDYSPRKTAAIANQGQNRMDVYLKWEREGLIPGPCDRVLDQLDRAAALATRRFLRSPEEANHDFRRDVRWARMIAGESFEQRGGWAIVIIGALHLLDVPGYLRYFLRRGESDCTPFLLEKTRSSRAPWTASI